MFRTVTVHPQELLCRYCMCRLWYVLIRPAGTTFEEELPPQTLYQRDVSPRTIVCTYSIYKEAPEDGPLRFETRRADTRVLINNQCNYIVYLVGMYIYCKIQVCLKWKKNNRYFTWREIYILTISPSVFLRMRNVLDKSCRQNPNTSFIFNNFLPKIVPRMRLTWKTTVEPDRSQMTKRRMRFACYISMATNTHS